MPWITNSKGFRNDKEFELNKSPNTVRILSIGDSFTAGYRVGQDETYSALLENSLNSRQDSVQYEVLVASIANPLQGLEYLIKHGVHYQPDIVLLGITMGNDIAECYLHLHEKGKNQLVGNQVLDNPDFDKAWLETEVIEEKLPVDSFEPASEINDLLDRFITLKLLKSVVYSSYQGESIFAIKGKVPPYIQDFTHGLGLYLKDQPESIHQGYLQLRSVLEAYKPLADNHDFEFYVGLFPQRFQVNDLDQRKTIEDYHLKAESFDWEAQNRIVWAYCQELGLHCIDPLVDFKKQNDILYLPGGDMHWNPKGHKAMAQVFLTEIWGTHVED